MIEDMLPNCIVESEVDYTDEFALARRDTIPAPQFTTTEQDLNNIPGVMVDKTFSKSQTDESRKSS